MGDWEGWHNGNPLILVNDERTILVTKHPNGTFSVALRDEPAAIWGPPIDLHPEYASSPTEGGQDA